MKYRNFDLDAFEYKPTDTTERFKVRVAGSPAGEQTIDAAEKVSLPLRVIQRLGPLRRRQLTLSEMIEFGEDLAKALFPPGVRSLLDGSLQRLKDDEGLRIRLRLDTYALAIWPWEYVYIAPPNTPANQKGPKGFLALDRRISLVRYELQGQPLVSLNPVGTGPLRLVALLASPDDPNYEPLDLAVERGSIEQALDDLGDVHADFFPDATTDSVLEALVRPAHVFHFSGHGEFKGDMGKRYGSLEGAGSVILLGDNRHAQPFPAESLALSLTGRGVRLAVLTACEVAQRDAVNVWTGVVPALTRAGIPAVVGMQYRILDVNAVAFSKAFYRALAAGQPIDAAVNDGRLAIFNRDSNDESRRDLGVPVLYLRVEEEEGVLFPKADGNGPQPVTETNKKVARPAPEPQIPRNEDIDQRALRIKMTQHLSPIDLDVVCQTVQKLLEEKGIKLQVNVSMVGGSNLPAQILNLIQYLDRRGYLGYLVAALRLERPDQDW